MIGKSDKNLRYQTKKIANEIYRQPPALCNQEKNGVGMKSVNLLIIPVSIALNIRERNRVEKNSLDQIFPFSA